MPTPEGRITEDDIRRIQRECSPAAFARGDADFQEECVGSHFDQLAPELKRQILDGPNEWLKIVAAEATEDQDVLKHLQNHPSRKVSSSARQRRIDLEGVL